MAADHVVTQLCLCYEESCWDNMLSCLHLVSSRKALPLTPPPNCSEVAFCWVDNSCCFPEQLVGTSQNKHSDLRYCCLCNKLSLSHQQMPSWHICRLSQPQIWSSYVSAALAEELQGKDLLRCNRLSLLSSG